MIKTDPVTINNKEYVKSYSDTGMRIERNGRRFSSALDPVGSDRQYIETDKPIPTSKPPKEPTLKPMYREATPMNPAKEKSPEEPEVSEESTSAEPVEQTEPAVVEETVPAEQSKPAEPEVNEA